MGLALTAAGCGFGSGEASSGSAELVVTRDHGTERLLSATVENPSDSETVTRFLDREAEIETSYGGNFVDSIDGIAGSGSGARRDWFFYVNGSWSPVGPAEADVTPGDRIWWDYRRWEAAYRVPVVVGSWPAPFAGAADEDPVGVQVECLAAPGCRTVEARIGDAGAELAAGTTDIRVVVGLWREVREDPDAATLADGPAESGVYVTGDGPRLIALGEDGRPAPGAPEIDGLVAAVRRGERSPAWIVTGTSAAGLQAAVESLDDALADHYALAVDRSGEDFSLPVVAG